MNPRAQLKLTLLEKRKVCEGRIYEEAVGKKVHKCGGGTHMSEVIFTRGDIVKVRGKDRNYFWDERNCALLCGDFHLFLEGHSTDFESWWLKYAEQYGDVIDYIEGAKRYLKVLA